MLACHVRRFLPQAVLACTLRLYFSDAVQESKFLTPILSMIVVLVRYNRRMLWLLTLSLIAFLPSVQQPYSDSRSLHSSRGYTNVSDAFERHRTWCQTALYSVTFRHWTCTNTRFPTLLSWIYSGLPEPIRKALAILLPTPFLSTMLPPVGSPQLASPIPSGPMSAPSASPSSPTSSSTSTAAPTTYEQYRAFFDDRDAWIAAFHHLYQTEQVERTHAEAVAAECAKVDVAAGEDAWNEAALTHAAATSAAQEAALARSQATLHSLTTCAAAAVRRTRPRSSHAPRPLTIGNMNSLLFRSCRRRGQP